MLESIISVEIGAANDYYMYDGINLLISSVEIWRPIQVLDPMPN